VLGIKGSTFVWFFVEQSNGSGDIKENGAAKSFSNLQLNGACASLEEAFA
jgi:hypothetical protein